MSQSIKGEEVAGCENCKYWQNSDDIEGFCPKQNFYVDCDDICHRWEPNSKYKERNDRAKK